MNIARHMNLSYSRSVKAMRRQGKYHSVIEATATRKISNRKAAKLCSDTLIDRLPAQIPRKDGGLIPGELRIGRAKKAAGGRMLATGLTRDLASEAEQSRVGNCHNAGSPKSSHHAQWRAESGHSGRPPGDVLPQLVRKSQHRLPSLADHVTRMEVRRMSACEIQGHLLGLYGLQVSPRADFDRHRGSADRGRAVAAASASKGIEDPTGHLAAGVNQFPIVFASGSRTASAQCA